MSDIEAASLLEELAREATIDDVAVLMDGNGEEQHGNTAVLKSAEALQVRNGLVSLKCLVLLLAAS
jgi:hypothetical protein